MNRTPAFVPEYTMYCVISCKLLHLVDLIQELTLSIAGSCQLQCIYHCLKPQESLHFSVEGLISQVVPWNMSNKH